MPKIRKKTSNRASTNDRAKLRHKITDGRKKNRKLAKKDQGKQWKSRVKKDPGIPNNLPFKEQILREVEEERRRAQEERLAKKASKKGAAAASTSTSTSASTQPDEEDDEEEDSQPSYAGIASLPSSRTTISAPSKKTKITSTSLTSEPIDEDEVEEEPLLFDPTFPDTRTVLDKASVWLYVLDARDPLAHRSGYVERIARESGKRVVFVLNKTDLVPKESTINWLSHLRQFHPTFPFRSASSHLPPPADDSTPSAVATTKSSRSSSSLDDALGKEALLEYLTLLRKESASGSSEEKSGSDSDKFTVAVVGLSNSGKSSLISSLTSTSRLPIYKTDSSKSSSTTTILPQPLLSSRGIQFVDTPGFELKPEVALHSSSSSITQSGADGGAVQMDVDEDEDRDAAAIIRKTTDVLLRCRGRIEKMNAPEIAARLIISRANAEDLILHYNTPAFLASDPDAFLGGHARATGRLKRGGVLDIADSARSILRDWRVGKFPYYSNPPHHSSSSSSASLTSSSSSAKSQGAHANENSDETLRSLYERTDALTLSSLPSRKELGSKTGGLIRMKSGNVDEREYSLEAPLVPVQTVDESLRKVRAAVERESNEDEDEEEVDDGLEGGSEDEDDDEDNEDDEEDEEEDTPPPPPPSSKRKRVGIDQQPKKRVAFAAKNAGPASSSASAPGSKSALSSLSSSSKSKGASFKSDDVDASTSLPTKGDGVRKLKSSFKATSAPSAPLASSSSKSTSTSKTAPKPTSKSTSTSKSVTKPAPAPLKVANKSAVGGVSSKKTAASGAGGASEAYDFGQFF